MIINIEAKAKINSSHMGFYFIILIKKRRLAFSH